MERISINDVVSGMKSALTIYNADGVILVDAGGIINDQDIEILKKEKIPGLYICDDTVSDIAYPFILSIETKISLINYLKKNAGNTTENFKEELKNKYLKVIIDELRVNEEIEVVPPEIRPSKDFDIFHKLNVSILSILTGIKIGLTSEELIELADLILTSSDKITKIKVQKYKEIVNIVKDFDLMVSGKDFSKNLPSFKALNNIVSNIDKNYKKDVTDCFLKVVAPYPLGTRVKLNTGETAVVMDINKTSIYKPIVRIIGNNRADTIYNEIDLLKHDTYVIVDVIF